MKIGFIGQGYVGKNYADNLEARGFEVVRYSMEQEFAKNKDKIKECEIVIVAVPTPTSKGVFDDSILRSVFSIINKGSTVVIKSTIILGTTEKLQQAFPDYFIMHSPEFLSERSARHDVDHPHAQIVGIPKDSPEYKLRAQKVLEVLPDAPFKKICSSLEAEFMKYSRNIHGFYEIIFYNLFYDLSNSLGVNYEVIKEYIKSDPLHVARYAPQYHP
jgi:UDPglucose 6-dehydrogenase